VIERCARIPTRRFAIVKYSETYQKHFAEGTHPFSESSEFEGTLVLESMIGQSVRERRNSVSERWALSYILEWRQADSRREGDLREDPP